MKKSAISAASGDRRPSVMVVLAVWFGIAATLVVTGMTRSMPGETPLRLLAAIAIPVAGFLSWYGVSMSFRRWVLGLDLRLLVMLQAWRVLGGMFLVLMTFGLLPALFAWPAGLGDVAVGATAPLVALALLRRPDFAASGGFIVWNLLGIFDFVVAVGTGVLTSGVVPVLAYGVNSGAMSAWPLAMIPGFLVPLFAILHIAAILQARTYGRGLTTAEGAGTLAA